MISPEELLKPLSEAQPCGADLYYDPAFQELEPMLRGKPETQFSPAEEPDWKQLLNHSLELFARSKDLRVATTLCVAGMSVGGLPALRDALAVLSGTVETHWDQLYPRLDPEDNNDPLQRCNILGGLATAQGTQGDPMKTLQRLRAVPLTNSVQMGRFGLHDIAMSQPGMVAPEGVTPTSAAQIEAAFRDTNPEHLAATSAAIVECIGSVKRLEEFLAKTIGADHAPNLVPLLAQFKEMQKCLAAYLPHGEGSAEPEAVSGGTAGPSGGAAKPSRSSAPGEIVSREDVVKTLDRICDYYARHERSSPVPHVLQRAKRLAQMDFMQIAQDLSPEAVAQLKVIFGEKDEPGS